MSGEASAREGRLAVDESVGAETCRDASPTGAEPRRLARSRTWRIVAIGFAAIVGLSLLLVSVRLEVVRASYDLAAEERTADRLLEERRHLVVERASLRSPARLAAMVSMRSTLQKPDADKWVRWPELGTVDRWPW